MKRGMARMLATLGPEIQVFLLLPLYPLLLYLRIYWVYGKTNKNQEYSYCERNVSYIFFSGCLTFVRNILNNVTDAHNVQHTIQSMLLYNYSFTTQPQKTEDNPIFVKWKTIWFFLNGKRWFFSKWKKTNVFG